jgi:hypothetical protein
VFKAPQKAVPVYEPRWTAWGSAYGGGNRTRAGPCRDWKPRRVCAHGGVAGGLAGRLEDASYREQKR